MTAIHEHISSGLTRERLTLELRRARRPFLIWLALLALALAGTAIILSKLNLPWPWQHEYRFQVTATDVSGVVSDDEVRIAGVPVGRVVAVGLQSSQPVITATISAQYGPLYRDARLQLRPNTPLQDMYLDVVSRGHRSAGVLPAGTALPVQQTQVAVQIGQVIDIFDASVRPRVRAAIDALGAGLDDHGADFRRALIELAPFLHAARQLTEAIATRQEETRRLIHNFGLMTAELARRDQQVTSLVRTGSITLERLASVERPLSALIEQLPPTLGVLPRSFAAVRFAADRLDPALTALLPAAQALSPALASLQSLSPIAEAALGALDRPLPSLTRLVDAANPLARNLERTFSALTPQAPRLDHVTAAMLPCELAVDKFFNWTMSTMKYYDSNGVIPRAAAGAGLATTSLAREPYLTAGASCAGGSPRK
jgi:virulence factor Mce-like protein